MTKPRSVELGLVEWSSYSEEPNELPVIGFDDVWSIIERNSDDLLAILVFSPSTGPGVGFLDLGSLKQLSPPVLREVKHRSYYGGHMSVFYKFRSESSLAAELTALFHGEQRLGNFDDESFGLEEQPQLSLRNLLATLEPNVVILTLAHDADPVYLLGQMDTIKLTSSERK